MENILEYFTKQRDNLLERLALLDKESKRVLSVFATRKEKHRVLINKSRKNLIPNNTEIDYSICGNGSHIMDRGGSALPLPSLNGGYMELPNIIETDEVTNLSRCVVSGQINKESKEIIDKSNITGFCEEFLSEEVLSNYTSNDIENTVLENKGLFFEIEISLPVLRKINYLTISGNSSYYQEIEYIRYSKTDMAYHRKDFTGFSKTSLKGDLEIKLQASMCKTIYIGIVQPHYTLVSKNLKTFYSYNTDITSVRAGYKCYDYISGIESTFITSTGGTNYLSANIETDIEKGLSEEFSVSYDGATYHNILPLSCDSVYERLLFHKGFSRLRFPCTDIIKVMADGIATSSYKTKSSNGVISSITMQAMPGVIYTIQYNVTSDAYMANISDVPFTIENEIIKADGSNLYNLRSIPLDPLDIDIELFDNIKARIYKGDSVQNISGNDKWNDSKFKFKIIGQTMFFDTELDDRYVVNIRYKSKGSGVMLKTVLRRNASGTLEHTQLISNIRLTGKRTVSYE